MKIVTLTVLLTLPTLSLAEEQSTEQVLQTFSQQWNNPGWQSGRRSYMRPADNDGWCSRMLALHRVVKEGQSTVPTMIKWLESGDVSQRIFAAQALGYLPGKEAEVVLLNAVKNDPSTPVRLYAVDALGMMGLKHDWEELAKGQRNRDVRKHLNYAKERDGKPVDPAIVQELANWNPKLIDTAIVGKPAPAFTATAATGEMIKLSNFRGKKNVVLVFIYGDT